MCARGDDDGGIVPGLPTRARTRRSLGGADDRALVAALRAGDDAAFEAVFDRYHRPLLGFCQHMLGSRVEAEDALQHVFLAVHRTLRVDDRPVELKPWLYAVAANRCTSILRGRREQVPLEQMPEPSTAGLALADEVESRADLKALLGDVAALPDDQRAALVLAELGDLDHAEIAATLGVRTDKVKALVFQARESLIGTRRARETDCTEIREHLATLRGSALRRSAITRHVAACPGCAAFQVAVRHQRAALGCVLPVAPALALKQELLAAVLAGSAGGAAAIATGSAGVVATTAPTVAGVAAVGGAGLAGGGAAAGGLAGSTSAVLAAAGSLGAVTKALVVVALAGGALGGGVALERDGDTLPAAAKKTAAPSAPAGRIARPAAAPAAAAGSARPAAGARPTTSPGQGRARARTRKASKADAGSGRSGATARAPRRPATAGAPVRGAKGGKRRGRTEATPAMPTTGQSAPGRTAAAGTRGLKAAKAPRSAAVAGAVASSARARKAPPVLTGVETPARKGTARAPARPATGDATGRAPR